MKFSILIPVYNVERYLKECLLSVFSQTFTDYEIILIDDGSTDGSAKICDEYAEKYPDKIKVIHKKNQGLISARRVGIQNASGEFCIFLDSDDGIQPELLSVLNDTLLKEPGTDIVLYSFRYWENGKYRDRKQTMFPDNTVFYDKKELYQRLINGCSINSFVTKAIRTEILKNDPTDYTKYYGKNMSEDLLQSLYPITAAKKIVYRDIPLYDYRTNPVSLSRNMNIEKLSSKNTVHVYDKIRECLDIWEMDSPECVDKLNARWVSEIIYLFRETYKDAKNRAERKSVVNYDWTSLLPYDAVNSIEKNKKVSPDTLNLWELINSHSYGKLYWLYFKQKTYHQLRALKRRFDRH